MIDFRLRVLNKTSVERLCLHLLIFLYFFGISHKGLYLLQIFLVLYFFTKLNAGHVILTNLVWVKVFFVIISVWVFLSFVINGFNEILPNIFTVVSLTHLLLVPEMRKEVVLNLIIKLAVLLSFWIWVVNYLAITKGIPFSIWRESDLHRLFIPGYPGNPVLPLSLAFYLALVYRKYLLMVIIAIGIFGLFTRIAYLALLFIPLVFLIYRMNTRTKITLMLILPPIIGLLFSKFSLLDNELVLVLFRSWDRIDVYQTSLALISESPMFGYGGRTIGVLEGLKIRHIPFQNWGHAHSYLDIAIRHGIPVLIFWILFMYFYLRKVVFKDYLIVLFIFPFFQIFIRDFLFYFTIILLIILSRREKESVPF